MASALLPELLLGKNQSPLIGFEHGAAVSYPQYNMKGERFYRNDSRGNICLCCSAAVKRILVQSVRLSWIRGRKIN